MERFSWDFHVRDDSAPPQTHTLGSKPSSSWQVSGLPERAFSRSWGPVPSPKTRWRKGSGSLQTPGTTRANEDGEIRTPGKGRDDPTRAPTAWGSGARRSRRPHLRTEAGASSSPARRPPPRLLSPEPAPGYEPDARESLAQPRGLGASGPAEGDVAPAQDSSSLPTTRRRGVFPCLLRWVSPGPAGKACLASDGESGTSGPDEGCLCGEDMP